MQIRFLIAASALLVIAPAIVAQDQKAAPAAASEASMAMPKPGPEHMQLAKAEGMWDASISSMGMPASKGTSEMKMSLNGFWLTETFKGDMGGMAFEGHSVTGYDPNKQKYVSTWIDNMSPNLYVFEGTFDQKTRTLTMLGEGFDQMSGKVVKMKNLTIHKDANTVVFEMYHIDGGNEVKMMTITYTRHAMPAKPAK